MSGKRPVPSDSLDDGDPKRVRSNDGSPARPSPQRESELEMKKRLAAERMAAVKARLAASKTNGSAVQMPATISEPAARASTDPTGHAQQPQPFSEVEAKKAEAQRKIAEIKARMEAQRAQRGIGTPSPVGAGIGVPPPPTGHMSEKDARIAEARARAAQLSQQRAINRTTAPPPPPPRQEAPAPRGGLGIGLHPSLMGDAGPSAGLSKPGAQKTQRKPAAPKTNIYLTGDDDAANLRHDDAIYDPSLAASKGKERASRQLVFNEKGKFMAQANALRQQAKLEEMKRRIAAETRKVEIEEAADKSFLVPAPPEVEWWDEGLLPEDQNTYADCLQNGRNKIETSDSIITALIQRPVLLQAPQDKLMPAPKPLMLTTKEQKKLRRQRRMADMKEEQAKIRLGLVDPPPPKVKKSNMMRVLGEQAVKDPTAVEARVNREIAQREHDHLQANEDRKLTKEQRHEKIKTQHETDAAKGLQMAVFRVDNLSSGKHRYQIDINAKQNALTGIVVLHPEMNLIIVEGGEHSIKTYKKLMLNRVKWTENTLPLNSTSGGVFTGGPAAPNSTGEAGAQKAATWCNPLDANGELKNLGDNRCVLVWEGSEQARAFRRWGSKAVETDGEARNVLSRSKMENMWTLAKSR